MKWGKKKSSPSSIITRVFPASWFSKFNHKPATNSAMQSYPLPNFHLTTNSSLPARRKEVRFHSVENGAYWSLSFRKERIQTNFNDCEFQLPASTFPGGEGSQNFKAMAFDLTKMKEKQHSDKVARENDAFRRKKPNGEDEFTTQRKNYVNYRRSGRRFVRKRAAELGVPCDAFMIEPENMDQMEDYQEAFKSRNHHSIKTDHQRKPAYKTREAYSKKIKQNRAKARSAKTECRIRVLEDMKKARVKLQQKANKERVAEGGTIYDSCAMVKCSFNPQQDFRDSMVQMISEKRISRAEELEELLACYLTLNCDRYHNIIIKIFQQVWFEMNRAVF